MNLVKKSKIEGAELLHGTNHNQFGKEGYRKFSYEGHKVTQVPNFTFTMCPPLLAHCARAVTCLGSDGARRPLESVTTCPPNPIQQKSGDGHRVDNPMSKIHLKKHVETYVIPTL